MICPFELDRLHSFFCTFSIDQRPVWKFIASLLIAFLHFISFRDNVWLNVQRDCFMEGLIRWESKSICQVMFDRLITGGSIKKPEWAQVTDKAAEAIMQRFGITSQCWTAIPIQRPPKVIHHEEFHLAP